MKIFKRWPNRLTGILILALVWQMILLGAVAAQDDAEKRRPSKPNFEDVSTKTINLKIIGKTPKMIRTDHINYVVMESTEVVDRKGIPMELAQLPVPCTAKVYYEPSRLNDPFVWRIVYKSKLSGATINWSPPMMQ